MPNQLSTQTVSTQTSSSFLTLTVAPGKIIRGSGVLQTASAEITRLGTRPLIIAGNSTQAIAQKRLQAILAQSNTAQSSYGVD
ncbi:oxidoreductase, partial [Nodularia sphaerocarpa CS-585A2]|nr:oxidoreductase [Nodularia sphaerocarpa CS-585A2]